MGGHSQVGHVFLIGKERHSSKIGPIFRGAYCDGSNHCLEVAKSLGEAASE